MAQETEGAGAMSRPAEAQDERVDVDGTRLGVAEGGLQDCNAGSLPCVEIELDRAHALGPHRGAFSSQQGGSSRLRVFAPVKPQAEPHRLESTCAGALHRDDGTEHGGRSITVTWRGTYPELGFRRGLRPVRPSSWTARRAPRSSAAAQIPPPPPSRSGRRTPC